MTLYQRLTAAGVQTENHYSDLYFPATEETLKILAEFAREARYRPSVSTFKNQVEGGIWYDVFGAFDPYWEAKA